MLAVTVINLNRNRVKEIASKVCNITLCYIWSKLYDIRGTTFVYFYHIFLPGPIIYRL